MRETGLRERGVQGWKPWPALALLVLLAGCAMDAEGPPEAPVAEDVTSAPAALGAWDGGPVRLISAVASAVPQGASYPYPVLHAVTTGTVWADPEVEPQRVTVHYQIRRNFDVVHDWDTVEATPAAGDLWEFQTDWYPMDCPHYCARIVFQFAVELQAADGTVSWDNNGGPYLDYVLASDFPGAVPVYHGPVGRLSEPVALSWARWLDGTFEGQVLVENLAYDKEITIVYSTDEWQTVQAAEATWGWMSMDSDLEHWRFRIPMPVPGQEVLFAIRYDVDGQTFWDNHLGRDYRLATPAGGEASIPDV